MTTSRSPVVVGVDGSPSAEAATRWAAREAALTGHPVHLVHSYPWAELSRWPGTLKPGMRNQDLFLAESREYLDRARREARDAAPGVEVTTEFGTRQPVEILTERSRSAECVVVGSRGLGGVTGLLLGSVGVGVAAHAACPVVVVRGEQGVGAGTGVVVGVDGSEHTEDVLAFGYEYAARHDLPLTVLAAWSDTAIDPTKAMFLDLDAILEQERSRVAECVAALREKYPDVEVRPEIVVDRPAHALVEASRDARMVVVGARGRGGMAGLLLGSTSQTLIHRAECPVAVVRG